MCWHVPTYWDSKTTVLLSRRNRKHVNSENPRFSYIFAGQQKDSLEGWDGTFTVHVHVETVVSLSRKWGQSAEKGLKSGRFRFQTISGRVDVFPQSERAKWRKSDTVTLLLLSRPKIWNWDSCSAVIGVILRHWDSRSAVKADCNVCFDVRRM